MKKNLYLIITLQAVMMASTAIAQTTPANYLDESARISKLVKYNSEPILFTVSKGMPYVSNESAALFESVLAKVIAAYNKSNKKIIFPSSRRAAAAPAQPPSGEPAPGPGQQPNLGGEVTSNGPGSSNTDADVSTQTEIRTELKWLFFLLYNDDPSKFAQVKDKFPKTFRYLDWEQSIIANSGEQSTSFAFNESAIIYGIVDFVIKRAKEEMVEVYLNKWYQNLNNDEIVKQLVPQSLNILKAFNDDQSLSVAKYGDKWKAAFQEDIRNLPVKLQDEAIVGQILTRANAGAGVQLQATSIISGGDKIVYDLYLKKHLVNILDEMSSGYLANPTVNNPVFKRMVVLANSLLAAGGQMENNKTYTPANLQQIKQMDIDAWRVLLKLLYIRHYDAWSFAFGETGMNNVYAQLLTNDKVNKFALLYKQSLSLISAYQERINGSLTSGETKLTFDESRKLFDLSFQFTGQIIDYLQLCQPQGDTSVVNKYHQLFTDYQNLKPIYTALSEIGEGVSNKQYGSVLDGTVALMKICDKNEKLTTQIKYLQLFGSFMVNIITAKDAGQVENALDEIIPKGSFELKNERTFSVSISAYPGVFGGGEKIAKYPENTTGAVLPGSLKESKWGVSTAFYLPIGIDLNLGSSRDEATRINNHSSTNFMFQVADLGAVFNYRLTGNNDNVKSDPNISFKQILSPGFAIMHHLKQSPLVYGFGVNYSPDLRMINQSGNEYKSGALRIGLFLAVDVTFLNLFASKKAQP